MDPVGAMHTCLAMDESLVAEQISALLQFW
jgi:hypothetical protein